MTFLNKELHDKWLNELFQQYQDELCGNQKGECSAVDTGLRAGDFPIVDATYIESGKHVFRCILKFTHDVRDKHYIFTEVDKAIDVPQGVTGQVVILFVDENVNVIDKGHYRMIILSH